VCFMSEMRVSRFAQNRKTQFCSSSPNQYYSATTRDDGQKLCGIRPPARP
jgi:hypothetical protein